MLKVPCVFIRFSLTELFSLYSLSPVYVHICILSIAMLLFKAPAFVHCHSCAFTRLRHECLLNRISIFRVDVFGLSFIVRSSQSTVRRLPSSVM